MSRPQFFGQKIIKRAGRPVGAEIHHHGNIGPGARDHRLLHRNPFRAVEVRRLDADDHLRIARRHLGGGLAVHVEGVLFVAAAAHPSAHDVEHHQDAGLGAIDDAVLEVFEIAPAGAAGIDHGGDAGAEGETVRQNTEIAGIGAALARAGIVVGVQVDQAGRHIHAAHIDGLDRVRRLEIGRDLGDMAILDGDIHHRIDMVLGVDDMPAAQQQVVGGQRLRHGAHRQQHQCGAGREQPHARTAVHLAGPYSPIFTAPDMRLPLAVPVNVQRMALPGTSIELRNSTWSPCTWPCSLPL